jgi:hypothetical protein
MKHRFAAPYPEELLRVAKKVVWYDRPQQTLGDLKTFLTHLMVYGSEADVSVVERYVPEEEFRRVLETAPAGVFTPEAWERWHERFGMMPVPPLPRRRFPAGFFCAGARELFGSAFQRHKRYPAARIPLSGFQRFPLASEVFAFQQKAF